MPLLPQHSKFSLNEVTPSFPNKLCVTPTLNKRITEIATTYLASASHKGKLFRVNTLGQICVDDKVVFDVPYELPEFLAGSTATDGAGNGDYDLWFSWTSLMVTVGFAGRTPVAYSPTFYYFAIITQPVNQSVLQPDSATFTVSAVTSVGTLSYQWYKNGAPVGENSPTYNTGATTWTGVDDTITCVVSNGITSVTSNNATLHVGLSVFLASLVGNGSTGTFAVKANSTSLYSLSVTGSDTGGVAPTGLTNAANVASWSGNVKSVRALNITTTAACMCIHLDGTCSYSGDGSDTGYGGVNRTYISSWINVVKIAGGQRSMAGLRSDGYLYYTGMNRFGEGNLNGQTGVIDFDLGVYQSVYLKSSGAVYTGFTSESYPDLSNSGGASAVAINGANVLLLYPNGTTSLRRGNASLFPGFNMSGVVAIQGGGSGQGFVGLTTSGTLVGMTPAGGAIPGISSWTGIVQFCVTQSGIIALKSDGTVVNNYGANTASWNALT